jgi:hypothetical protein
MAELPDSRYEGVLPSPPEPPRDEEIPPPPDDEPGSVGGEPTTVNPIIDK